MTETVVIDKLNLFISPGQNPVNKLDLFLSPLVCLVILMDRMIDFDFLYPSFSLMVFCKEIQLAWIFFYWT